MVSAMTCDPYRRLLAAYVTGRLPAADAQAVASHIGVCPDCAAMVVDMMPAAEWLSGTGAPAADTLPVIELLDSASVSSVQPASGNQSAAKRFEPAGAPVAAQASATPALAMPGPAVRIPRSLVTVVGACVLALIAWYWWPAGDEAATPALWLLQEHAGAQYRASGATLLGPMLSTLEMGEAP
jgi:anti-sigma factor RsiW